MGLVGLHYQFTPLFGRFPCLIILYGVALLLNGALPRGESEIRGKSLCI
jgi:hypothetical protein